MSSKADRVTIAEPKGVDSLSVPEGSDIKITGDLSIFNRMEGNRDVSERHVQELIGLLRRHGNLTDTLPIEVDANMQVLDGQHRLEALRRLSWPVAYRIVAGNATVERVRVMNTGQKNWDWADIIHSFKDQGIEEYIWLEEYMEEHKLLYSEVRALIRNGASGKTFFRDIRAGDVRIVNKPEAHLNARRWNEIKRQLVEYDSLHSKSKMVQAWAVIQASPSYNHERMLSKIADAGGVEIAGGLIDYQRNFEDAYNYHYSTRTRLF